MKKISHALSGVYELKTLFEALEIYNPKANLKKIEEAYLFSKKAHGGQFRKSGEAYIEHPLAVAVLLTQLHVDESTVMAALLHDVPEDTSYTLEDVRENFGKDVASLVYGVTKLSKVKYKMDMEQYQVDCLRKMFLMLSQDLRVVLIKLADRLHNMRTLMAVRPEKRVRIAKETLEIYAPLADRLGIWSFKWELEDLCFQHLFPLQFDKLTHELYLGQKQREKLILQIQKVLSKSIKEELKLKDLEISGRAKHLYSIFRKMERKHKTLDEVYDLFAIRVVVEKVSDCYAVLGIIHELWKPKADRFKDYIAAPKSNGYRSLHTTVFCFGGTLVEFQIRTREMHEQAEHGVAAHWIYKDKGKSQVVSGKNLNWLKRLKDLQENIQDSKEFVEGVKVDLFETRMFVFTPDGDVKDLPEGANAIDFAFAVHTSVGYRCQGAKVNGKIVRLDQPLKTGDVVDIITSKTIIGPKRDWLRLVVTIRAKNRIKAWFRRQDRDANLNSGIELLSRELAFFGKGSMGDLSEEKKKKLLLVYPSYKNLDDIMVAIGEGDLSQRVVLKKIFSDAELLQGPIVSGKTTLAAAKRTMYVQGEKDVMAIFAKCCNPVLPDPVVGYITRGRGVTIHKQDCRSLKHLAPDRLVHASWLHPSLQPRYQVKIVVEFRDRIGFLRDITIELAKFNINLLSVTVHPKDSKGKVKDDLLVEVSSVDQMTALLDSIHMVPGVIRAYQVKQK